MSEDTSENSNEMAEQEAAELLKLRDKIDQIDESIGKLISERAECAFNVGEIKNKYAVEKLTNFYRPEREAQVLRKAMDRNKGPLKDEEVARLFREIMSACLALEEPINVAYLGPEGTYTQEATLKHFGHSAKVVSRPTIDSVFRDVAAGAVQYGVVPVENSTEGVVTHTLDNFMASNLKICGEVVIRICHHLLVSDVTESDKITRIYSHAQSLAQCRNWLDTNFPNAERISVNSNAEAAKRIKGEWNAAAIASEIAADLYGLSSYAARIEDQPDNSTRFLIIGREDVGPSGQDKTSIVVSTRNEPGALHDLLEPFHRNQIDLTRVETRPSNTGVWNYVFFIDFSGHIQSEKVSLVLDELKPIVSDLKILGSYPVGVL